MDTNTLLALVSIVGVFVALVLILRIRRDDHKSFSWEILSLLFGSGIKSMVQHGVDSTAKAIKQQGVNQRASPGSGGGASETRPEDMRINEPPIPDLSAEISRKDIGTQQARREGSSPSHRLMVYLCHSSADKLAVRTLYEKLVTQSIDTWLDEENLLPGEDWQREIPRAVKNADVVIVCLSKQSVNKQGYLQKEIRFALDAADEKPEGTIFLIPARLEECVVPERLEKWQWVNLYEENGFERLMRALKKRSAAIGIDK